MLKIKRDDEVIVIAGKDVVAVLPHPVQQLRLRSDQQQRRSVAQPGDRAGPVGIRVREHAPDLL